MASTRSRSGRTRSVARSAAGVTSALLVVGALLGWAPVPGLAGTAGARTTTTSPDDAGASPPTLDSTVPAGDAQVTVTSDLQYYEGSAPYDAYLPAGDEGPRPALILVHGGGWQGGDQTEVAPYAMDAAANQGWAAFTVNYRLDGDDTSAWADELHDVQAAIRHIVGTMGEQYRIDQDRVALLGDSAGANLLALVSEVGTADPVTGSPVGDSPDLAVPIRAVALWSPPTDLEALAPTVPGRPPAGCGQDPACDFTWSGSTLTDYLGCEVTACPDRYRDASPISHVSGSVPPTYIANSTEELVPLDQVEAYATALRAADVPVRLQVVDGDLHAAQLGPQVWPESVNFLSRHLGGAEEGSGRWLLAVGGGAVVLVAGAAVAVAVVEHRRHRGPRIGPGGPGDTAPPPVPG